MSPSQFQRPEVKICGTTTAEDVAIAVAAGANAIGIICPPLSGTRHSVEVEQAVRLARAVPDSVTTVLIPRLTNAAEIIELAKLVKPDRLQLGETEDLEVLQAVGAAKVAPQVAQVVHVGDDSAIQRAAEFVAVADVIHLDSAGDQPGGTGHVHDWTISRTIADAVQAAGKPLILAGGLTADNVTEAIAAVRPDGVDVESGIKGPGIAHDPQRVADFVTAAQAAFHSPKKA